MLLSVAVLTSAILLLIWAAMSCVTIFLLITYSRCAPVALASIFLYSAVCVSIIVFLLSSLSAGGLELLLPSFFSPY